MDLDDFDSGERVWMKIKTLDESTGEKELDVLTEVRGLGGLTEGK